MYDQNQKHNVAASQAERRDGARRPFIAAAEVVELRSGARFSTRTTDLGPGGCFLDTLMPFDAGAKVRITIREGQHRFEASGSVIYSQSGLGMGVSFDPLKPEQRKTLSLWFGEEADQQQHAQAYESEQSAQAGGSKGGSDHESLVRLVKLLVSKGVLSEVEAASICSDPVFL